MSDQNDRHIPKVHCSTGSLHADFDFAPKKYDPRSFFNDWNDQGSTIFDIPMRPLRVDKKKNTDIVLPVKEGPQIP